MTEESISSSTTSIKITRSLERDSLEKIHTFSLKSSLLNNIKDNSPEVQNEASKMKGILASGNAIDK
jgi:hypothetical protein